MNSLKTSLYDFTVQTIDGFQSSLTPYQGKVLLIVNVASNCGFTNQYTGLQNLYDKYKDQGFSVLAFPCNQFAGQEPGTEKEIKNFCQLNYEVQFPLFAKIKVNGPNTHPLYQYLKRMKPGLLGSEAIKWNFTKFLVSRKGNILKRFSSQRAPQTLYEEIERALTEPFN
ncbi:MAG: Glutathione peroxidase [Francisellaceae bacterium]|nr:Glutathione peroxidase [Francisellaceae bacterium]